ncbi:DUF6115 domain-containing protein [Bacillus xiapuensis]|uniref:DUF6115 domain-containing protein n=1 Tax=Bacillus xiapuensis TaxID=2014075 RepID=UPI000C24F6E4|nr:hypothetical protein [Bacillus xiapuensis]
MMMTAFILISFLLHAVSLFAVILLFTRQNRLIEVKKQQQKIAKDMEEMMEAYLIEMKEENEKFIRELSEPVKEPPPAPSDKQTAKAEGAKGTSPNLALTLPSLQRARAANGYKSISSQEQAVEEETEEASASPDNIESRIFQLRNQGMSNEEIAKKLNKGKTEIELALKFFNAGKNS